MPSVAVKYHEPERLTARYTNQKILQLRRQLETSVRTGKTDFRRRSPEDVISTGIMRNRASVATFSEESITAAESRHNAAAAYLEDLRNTLEAMLAVAQQASSGSLEEIRIAGVIFNNMREAAVAKLGGYRTGSTQLWGAAYPGTISIDGRNVDFTLPQLNAAGGGNFAMDNLSLTLNGTGNDAAAISLTAGVSATRIRDVLLNVVSAQAVVCSTHLSDMAMHKNMMQEQAAKASDEVAGVEVYDLTNAANDAAEILNYAHAGSIFAALRSAESKAAQEAAREAVR